MSWLIARRIAALVLAADALSAVLVAWLFLASLAHNATRWQAEFLTTPDAFGSRANRDCGNNGVAEFQSAFARRSEGVMIPRHRQSGVTRRTIDMSETIDLGALKLNFLQSKDTTDGSIDMFEMTVRPNARMPIPHYHDRWDETVYGLTGTTTFRVDGKDIDIGPGETVFIKRGIVHWFTNRTAEPSTCLCTLSPGVLGPQYFKDIAKLLVAGAPDPAKMKETMLRYGLIPAPSPS